MEANGSRRVTIGDTQFFRRNLRRDKGRISAHVATNEELGGQAVERARVALASCRAYLCRSEFVTSYREGRLAGLGRTVGLIAAEENAQ